jgi:DNA helicase-2/ATP-dependent DNA helicase PcrA
MTRARDLLYFTAAKFYGEGKRIKKISPFVYETLGQQFDNLTMEQFNNNQLSIFDFKPIKETILEPLKVPYKITYISYSQLETFKRCPLEYKFKYILGIPIPTSAAAAYGTSVHAALRDFYALVKEGLQPTNDQLLKFLAESWQREGYTSKIHEKNMYKKAQESLAAFFTKGYKKNDHPLALEQPFIIKAFLNLKIGGRLDRVDQLGNEEIEIIDYKTGKISTQKEVDKNMQMTIYAMAAADKGIYHKDLNKVTLSFYFLEKQQKISTVRTLADLEKAKEEIKETVAKIEKSDFLPTSGRHCDFCPYRLLCPSWK